MHCSKHKYGTVQVQFLNPLSYDITYVFDLLDISVWFVLY
jgi:hypothetical protein